MGCNINVGSPILRTDLAQSIRLTTRVDKEILCQDFQDASVKIADVEIHNHKNIVLLHHLMYADNFDF